MRGTGAGVGAVGGGVPGDGAGPPMMLERMDAALLDEAAVRETVRDVSVKMPNHIVIHYQRESEREREREMFGLQ